MRSAAAKRCSFCRARVLGASLVYAGRACPAQVMQVALQVLPVMGEEATDTNIYGYIRIYTDIPSLPQVVTAAAKWSPGALLVTAAGAAPASAPAAAAEAPTDVPRPGGTPVLRGWGDLTRADGGERPLGALLTGVQCQSRPQFGRLGIALHSWAVVASARLVCC